MSNVISASSTSNIVLFDLSSILTFESIGHGSVHIDKSYSCSLSSLVCLSYKGIILRGKCS